MRLLMAIRSRDFSVETMYNSNSNSNSNKVDVIRITHNSNKGNINRIVRVSSNPSINAKCV
jgi:CRISPR/Cas system-associated protein Cas7 (RAMP superfamily)